MAWAWLLSSFGHLGDCPEEGKGERERETYRIGCQFVALSDEVIRIDLAELFIIVVHQSFVFTQCIELAKSSETLVFIIFTHILTNVSIFKKPNNRFVGTTVV